ncbi:unnamed protein product [Microthlaspi erraticum]|uniref:IST1-like protein n=1 Tax=Microthlaspi erraticum TaxID=1685480 RepID=A0A6D2IQY3_9BRAS|nr:unnamed protein product [Microthlaspi erraticum]
MKKVLHRSFKPAKCKSALQMAASRLKILKNKKDTQIKQLRREIAQLLESGQTQTAQIRVEHVVREEKTVAAYELLSIYCELLVARLGVIDSQKTCPTDLKESVGSVLYASKRLSDVTELADVVKQFTAKYGKDFVSAAVGLQPSSGVSRLLVDKLSVKAPDGPTKIKLLKEIAAEHNVTWEAESLVESDTKETVSSSGASSSQSAIGRNSESSRIPHNQPPKTINVPQNSYAVDGRSSSHTASTDYNVGKTGDHYHQDPRPSGSKTDAREQRHPSPSYVDSSPWETEFVDATSAARAAAESAERAGFAARAAAELSSKERMMKSMQNSTKSRNSSAYDSSKNEPPHRHSSSSNVQSSNRQEVQEDKSTIRAESSKKAVDEVSENASFAEIGREKKKKPMDDINHSCSEDVPLEKLSSRASSGSDRSYISDDNNAAASDHIDAPSILEDNIFHSTVVDTESLNHDPDVVEAPAFDDYSSFFDKPQFDTEDVYRDEPEHGLGFSLLGSSSSKTPDHMPTETDSWSFKEHNSLGQPSSASNSQVLEKEKPSSPLFDDGPTSPPASLHEHEPEPSPKFDDYDRDSESEEENNLSNKGKLSASLEEKPKLTSHKSSVSETPDDLGRYFFPSDTEDQEDDSRPQDDFDAETPTGGLKNEETLPSYEMSPPRDNALSKSVEEHVHTEVDPSRSSSSQTVSSSSIRKDLYTQKPSKPEKRPSSIPPDSSSSDDETEMELRKRVSIRNQDKRTESRTRPSHRHSRVSEEDSEEKLPARASTRSQEGRTHKTTPASSASYFHSLSSDEEDDKEVTIDVVRNQTKPSVSISRRTKGQEKRSSLVTARTDKVSHDQESPQQLIPKAKPLAKQDKASYDQESPPKVYPRAKQQGSTSSSSSIPETNKVSHHRESPPKVYPRAKPLAKQEGSASSSSSLPKTKKVSHQQESPPKVGSEVKSLAKQEGSASSLSSLPKTVTPPESETPAKEKASHVHPKLPDYDDIFAKLGALRR